MTSPVKTSELPTQSVMTPDDYFVGINDPAGVPATSKYTNAAVFGNVATVAVFTANVTTTALLTANTLSVANLSLTDHHTPSSSGEVVAIGKLWFDANYLYVAVANNTLKRVALSSF